MKYKVDPSISFIIKPNEKVLWTGSPSSRPSFISSMISPFIWILLKIAALFKIKIFEINLYFSLLFLVLIIIIGVLNLLPKKEDRKYVITNQRLIIEIRDEFNCQSTINYWAKEIKEIGLRSTFLERLSGVGSIWMSMMGEEVEQESEIGIGWKGLTFFNLKTRGKTSSYTCILRNLSDYRKAYKALQKMA